MNLALEIPMSEQYLLIVLALLLIVYMVSRFETRRYYIVRHGQTAMNELGMKQGVEGGLSTPGKQQAELAGLYLSQFNIQHTYSSPYERALQTANIINERVRAGKVCTTPLLAERRNPSEVIGRSKEDPEVKRVIDLIEMRFHEDDFRYSDEENFADLTSRARKCLRYLGSRSGQRFCVVTHHVFLKALLSCMMHPSELHEADYVKFAFFNQADNGGITICEYRRWKAWFSPTSGWDILVYNEQLEVPVTPNSRGLEAHPKDESDLPNLSGTTPAAPTVTDAVPRTT